MVLERSQLHKKSVWRLYCVMLSRFERVEGVTCLYIALLYVSCLIFARSAGCVELPPTLLIARSLPVHVISPFPRVQRSLNN